uniref:Nanos-type domain-containing protein n=1 Tax=Angiostrongylus cantonensis TaxID=6313 RepID=A0A0K0DRI9_ANGCA
MVRTCQQERVEQTVYRALREFQGTEESPQYRGTHSDDGSSNLESNNNDWLPHKNEQSNSTVSGVHRGSERLVFKVDCGIETENSQPFKREGFCWYCYEKCLEECAAESTIPPNVYTRCFWHQGHCVRDGKIVTDRPHEWVTTTKCRHCGTSARGPHANSHSPVLEFDKLSLHST